MTTSCIINFTDGENTISIYKHNDGMPERVIPLLADFLKWNKRDDLDYIVANFIYYAKNQDYDKQLGYGVCADNYVPDFIVNINKKMITSVNTSSQHLYNQEIINNSMENDK